ncbi:MAG: DUF3365 domain-containing protein [Nannocystaceae bacterium]|nr:DUF3365 domain-containing protein [Nannocystaceae bacterium]
MRVPTAGAVLLALAACRGDKTYARDAVPSALAPAVAAAEAALDAMQKQLAGRLGEALAAGGPLAAVSVCSEQAQSLTAAIATEHGVALGRTSHKLRNPANAPRPWLQPFVDRALTDPIAGPMVVDLGESVGVVRPIYVAGPCLQCHGDSAHVGADVAAALHRAYPDDRAVGFADGALRGFAWAEAPR